MSRAKPSFTYRLIGKKRVVLKNGDKATVVLKRLIANKGAASNLTDALAVSLRDIQGKYSVIPLPPQVVMPFSGMLNDDNAAKKFLNVLAAKTEQLDTEAVSSDRFSSEWEKLATELSQDFE